MDKKFKFSSRNKNGIKYVTVAESDSTYNELVAALKGKYPGVIITSGGAYTSVTGKLKTTKA